MAQKTRTLVSRYQVEFKKNEGFGILNDRNESYKESGKVAAFCKELYKQENAVIGYCEYCFALLLDRANHISGYIKVSEGGLTATVIDNRKVVKAALDANASGIILVHNHPSSSPLPSKSDLRMTDELHKALGYFDIKLLDHIILSEGTFFSFADDAEKPY